MVTATEVRRKWVEALRSGEFKQGTDTLCRGDEYCCLGVLCELTHRNGWTEVGKIDGASSSSGDVEYDGCDIDLPRSVRVLVGMRTDTGVFWDPKNKRSSLILLNDTGISFSSLADIIESEPDGLFWDVDQKGPKP